MDNYQMSAGARELTANIIAAYVANNSLRSSDLPEIIAAVYGALTGLKPTPAAPKAEQRAPPVSIKKSLQSDYLISMEDGKRYQSLKRHLSKHGLTPNEYRTKWGLPNDYPMVAPAYSERRSAMAKSLGLGRKRSGAANLDEPIKAAEGAPKSKRGRKKAARG